MFWCSEISLIRHLENLFLSYLKITKLSIKMITTL